MKVAVYCRVACADQLALDMQVASVKAFAEEQGHDVVRCIADNGVSGLRNQASIDQLIELARGKAIDGVVSKDPSRLTRDPIQLQTTEVELAKQGCKMIFPPPYDELHEMSKGLTNLIYGNIARPANNTMKHRKE